MLSLKYSAQRPYGTNGCYERGHCERWDRVGAWYCATAGPQSVATSGRRVGLPVVHCSSSVNEIGGVAQWGSCP
eukprot:8186663-Lingulodinium_polyedra.AAC.1